MGVTMTVQLILLAYIHTPCHSGKLVMKHDYLSRMKEELSTHCPYATACKYSSSDGEKFDDSLPGVPSESQGLVSCCNQCYCDPLCERYRQCCPKTLLELYGDGEPVDEIPFECEMPYFKIPTRKLYVFEGRFMTDRCLESGEWSREDRMKCENRNISNIEEMIPVESEETRTAYVNKYCAVCNADDATMVTWVAYVGPVDQGDSPSVMQKYSLLHWKDIYKLSYDPDSELNMVFMSPFDRQDSCTSPVITDCNVTGFWQSYDPFYEFACKVNRVNYYHAHSNHSVARVFGNVFCAICNGLPPVVKECYKPASQFINEGYIALINYKDSAEFSSNLAGPPLDAAETKLCPEKDFYDPLNVSLAAFGPHIEVTDQGL